MSNDELQAEDPNQLDVDAGKTEPVDSQTATKASDDKQSESATETGADQPKKVVFDEEQQKKFDKGIDRVTFRLNESQRKSKVEADELRQKLADAEALIPQPIQPVIPELPDRDDEDFASRMEVYNQAIQADADFKASQKVANDKLVDAERTALEKQQTEWKAASDSYFKKAETLGISQQEAFDAGKVIADFGVNPYVQQHIQKEAGPAVATYLKNHPEQLQSLVSLDITSGIAFVTRLEAAATASVTKQPPDTPDPANELKGAGAPPDDGRLKGSFYVD